MRWSIVAWKHIYTVLQVLNPNGGPSGCLGQNGSTIPPSKGQSNPFEEVYGRPPPTVMSCTPGDTALALLDTALQDRVQVLHHELPPITSAGNHRHVARTESRDFSPNHENLRD